MSLHAQAAAAGVHVSTLYRRRGPARDRGQLRRYRAHEQGKASSGRALHTARTRSLLIRLGVPKTELAPGNREFWRANGMIAEHLAHLARARYRARMRQLHPDTNGNGAADALEARTLNQIMETLRERFRRRGLQL